MPTGFNAGSPTRVFELRFEKPEGQRGSQGLPSFSIQPGQPGQADIPIL